MAQPSNNTDQSTPLSQDSRRTSGGSSGAPSSVTLGSTDTSASIQSLTMDECDHYPNTRNARSSLGNCFLPRYDRGSDYLEYTRIEWNDWNNHGYGSATIDFGPPLNNYSFLDPQPMHRMIVRSGMCFLLHIRHIAGFDICYILYT